MARGKATPADRGFPKAPRKTPKAGPKATTPPVKSIKTKPSATAPAGVPLSPLSAVPAVATGGPVPPSLFLPTVKVVEAGVWYRVHDYDAVTGNYAAAAFNASGQGNARFSPLFRKDGSVIPTIYAAGHVRTAIAEILFHEATVPSTGWTFEWSKVRSTTTSTKHLSKVTLPALKLAALTTFGLQAAGLLVDHLLGGDATEYDRTQQWAMWLYENMPDIQGLYWMSRRDNEYPCVMLFGDRVVGVAKVNSSHISAFEKDVFSVLLAMNATIA